MQGLAYASLAIWVVILLLPWRPWGTRESLNVDGKTPDTDLTDITVLIPARNEGAVIEQTLAALEEQSPSMPVIVVDDQSTDDTAEILSSNSRPGLTVIHGDTTPPGWSGKLWALEQARRIARTKYLLLLDADIELAPGLVATLKQKMINEEVHLLSLMARLRMQSFWEKLLIPAFIYFFKLLYPFSLSNRGSRFVAAAAGGCILLRADSLETIGGFSALKHALIDDCTLARCFRERGFRTWTGLSHSAVSLRAYHDLADIWHMVTRTAFTQLHYSWLLLALCIITMTVVFVVPVIHVLAASGWQHWISLAALAVMIATYCPVLRYYRLNPLWSLLLPVAGLLYLLMTCHSAFNHTFGKGAYWKGRSYSKEVGNPMETRQ